MRVKINGQITLPSTLEQAASFVASQTKNDTNMVLGGRTSVQDKKKDEATEKTNQKPAEQTTQPRATEVPEPPITTTPTATTTVSNISNGVGAPVVAPAGNTIVST